MKKYLAWVLIPMVLASLTGCGTDTEEVPELLEPVDVKTDMAEAQMGDVLNVAVYSGEVVPYVEDVHFSVDGSLERVHVSIGDTVQEGDVLASLDTEQILEQIENLEKEISHMEKLGEFSDRKAELTIEIAKEELAVLEETGAGEQACAEKQLEIQKLELQLKQTGKLRDLDLEEKQRSLETLQEKIDQNQMTAPFDGTVVYISEAGQGDQIQAYTPVVYLADNSQLSLAAEYIPDYAVTYTDRIYAKIMDKEYELSYVPYEDSEYIAMILYGEEPKAQFAFEAPDEFLESGQYAAIVVEKSHRENVLTLPVNALYKDGIDWYVYMQEDGERVRRDVKTGLVSDTNAEITEGLKEGDLVYVKE